MPPKQSKHVSQPSGSETEGHDDYYDEYHGNLGEFGPGISLNTTNNAGATAGMSGGVGVTRDHDRSVSEPNPNEGTRYDRADIEAIVRDAVDNCLPSLLNHVSPSKGSGEKTEAMGQNDLGRRDTHILSDDSGGPWEMLLTRGNTSSRTERAGYQRDYYSRDVPLSPNPWGNDNFRSRTRQRDIDRFNSRNMTALFGSATSPVGFGGFNSGNRRDYSRPHYSPRRAGYQTDTPRNYYTPREDYNIKVRPFYPKETDWFTYKSHFEAIASQAVWSPKTKCVKLMGALQGSLTGVTAGMKHPVSYDQLVARLDSVYGISNDRDDALIKISNCRKGHEESIPMFGERIRQLIERAYPNFSPADKDEQVYHPGVIFD